MSQLWLPPEFEGQMEAVRVQVFTDRLRAFDERMECVLATQDVPEQGVRQGFYYLVRHNEDGTKGTWEVHEEGRFREPDERDIDALRMLDLRNPARVREIRERRDRKIREREANVRRLHEDMVGEAEEVAAHFTRTHVSLNDGKRAA